MCVPCSTKRRPEPARSPFLFLIHCARRILMKQLIATGLIVAASVTSAWAQPARGAAIDVGNPWVRATVAQQKATGAFMQLTARADTRLVAAQSPVAGVVEIHEMVMDRDVMKMRAMPAGLALPAGQTVELKPGGYHVMLLDLKG